MSTPSFTPNQPLPGNVPQAGSGGLEAGSSATMQSLKALAEHLGQQMALQHMAQGRVTFGGDGKMVGGFSSSPGTPTVMPETTPPGMVPNINPALQTSPDLLKEQARNNVINMVRDGVNKFVEKKQKTDALKAEHDYTSLMTAISTNKMLDPNDPQQSQILERNNAIIESILGDSGKAARLQKVLGFDAYDMKAEAKKQSDPHYQGFQKALQNVHKLGVDNVTLPNDMGGNIDLNNMPVGANAGSGNSKAIGWEKNLSPVAQKFLQSMPMTYTQPQYMMGPNDTKMATLIATKVLPDGNAMAAAIPELSKDITVGFGNLAKTLKDEDVAKIESEVKLQGNYYDNMTKLHLGTLEAGIKQQQLAIDGINADTARFNASIGAGRLSLEQAQFGQGLYTKKLDSVNQQIQATQAQIALRQTDLQKDGDFIGSGSGDRKKGISDDLANAYKKLGELHNQQFATQKDLDNFNAKFGKGNSYGKQSAAGTTGAAAVDKFSQSRNDSSTNNGVPSNSSTPNVSAPSTSGSSIFGRFGKAVHTIYDGINSQPVPDNREPI